MRKKSIVAAALLCILIIGITSLYLAGCSNTAKETAVLEEAGTAVSGNAVSENTDDRAGTDTDSDTVKGTEAETGNGETEAQEDGTFCGKSPGEGDLCYRSYGRNLQYG